jgi:hypothetical protein
VPISRTVATAVLAAALAASLGGCGFIAAGNKSVTKPSGFVLSGQAAVALPAASSATVGSPCQSPAGATDVAADVAVTITGDTGTKIATGKLGAGIVTSSGTALRCSFPFQIPAVPGGNTSYGIAVGTRPAQTFPGDQLRQSTQAVVTITPDATPS